MAVAFQASGSAFRINTQTLGNQEGPDVAVLSTGGFVVVWEDHNEPLTNANIKGQIYAASGAKFAGEFLVNTQTTGNQVFPAVTGLSGGRFVVTWTDGSGIGDGNLASVQAQIFAASGAKIGSGSRSCGPVRCRTGVRRCTRPSTPRRRTGSTSSGPG